MTGYELGKHSAVPLSRSYEVLERLNQKGLALVQPGNVPRYAAARLIVFSSSSRWQLEQTFRSTWYGTPARCRIA